MNTFSSLAACANRNHRNPVMKCCTFVVTPKFFNRFQDRAQYFKFFPNKYLYVIHVLILNILAVKLRNLTHGQCCAQNST